jgi:hypothetical protein
MFEIRNSRFEVKPKVGVLMHTIRLVVSAALVGTAVLLSVPVTAHHSAAMFDDTKVLELKGTVKELQWTNPHVWLQIIVDEKGRKTEWSVEGGSPNSLSRQGWRATSFKAGDVVTVRINPMKDGTPAGNFVAARFESDGRTLGRWQ